MAKSRTSEEQMSLDNGLLMLITLYGESNTNKEDRKQMLNEIDSLISQGADVLQLTDDGKSLDAFVDPKQFPELFKIINQAIILRNASDTESDLVTIDLVSKLEKNLKILLTKKPKPLSTRGAKEFLGALSEMQTKELSPDLKAKVSKWLPAILQVYKEGVTPEKFAILKEALDNNVEPNALTTIFAELQRKHEQSSMAKIASSLNPSTPADTLGEVSRSRSNVVVSSPNSNEVTMRSRVARGAPPPPANAMKSGVARPREPRSVSPSVSPTGSPPTKRAAGVLKTADPSVSEERGESLGAIKKLLVSIVKSEKVVSGDTLVKLNNMIKGYNLKYSEGISLSVTGKNKGKPEEVTSTFPLANDRFAHMNAVSIDQGIKKGGLELVNDLGKNIQQEQEESPRRKM